MKMFSSVLAILKDRKQYDCYKAIRGGVYGKSSIESTVNDFLKKRGLNVVGQRE